MLGAFLYIFEVKKEILLCFSLSILYVTYYLVEVVKKPLLICRKGDFRDFLEENIPLLKEPYWPTPWCVESRLQTVLGSLIRTRFLPTISYRREILKLSDGGQVGLDWAEWGEEEAGPEWERRGVVVVLPGLAGGAHADYVRCLAAAARRRRLRLVVYHYRGRAGVPLTTPRLYCAVSHADLAEVLDALAARYPAAPLLAAGVSLGGLMLGHYLAEAGPRARVAGALAVSVPLDVPRGAASLERGVNAPLSWHMARRLRRTVAAHACLPVDGAALARCRSLRQFDALFTARHFGFGSAEEYYRAASLRGRLGAVRAPLLCLCAADDPLQPLAALPAREAAAAARVALAVPARGGHLGFLEGWWPAGAPHTQYLARLADQYFGALLAHPHLLHSPPPAPAPSPAPANAPAPL